MQPGVSQFLIFIVKFFSFNPARKRGIESLSIHFNSSLAKIYIHVLSATFNDIKNDKSLLYDIHPVDLMKITIDDYVASQKKSMLSISEILRDNRYKLSDSNVEEVLPGDSICDNILLIEKIKNIDLYKLKIRIGLRDNIFYLLNYSNILIVIKNLSF